MTLYLLAKHKISKPSPIFTKIEQSDIDRFKAKYGGSQTEKKSSTEQKPARTVEEIKTDVIRQANKVRELKSKKIEKSALQPEISLLLELKKELAQKEKETGK